MTLELQALPPEAIAHALTHAPKPKVSTIRANDDDDACTKKLTDAAWSILRVRRARDEILPARFADPAWDILLFLYATQHSERLATISDACVAAAVPSSTALRFIMNMESEKLIQRIPDKIDRRRNFLVLSPDMDAKMSNWLVRFCNTMSC